MIILCVYVEKKNNRLTRSQQTHPKAETL